MNFYQEIKNALTYKAQRKRKIYNIMQKIIIILLPILAAPKTVVLVEILGTEQHIFQQVSAVK